MVNNIPDFIPNFSSDEDESDALTDDLRAEPSIQSYRHEPEREGIEVNIYFPVEAASDAPIDIAARISEARPINSALEPPEETRPHQFSFPDDPPTRPAVRTTEIPKTAPGLAGAAPTVRRKGSRG